jgi:hypothetical protein
MPSDLKLNLRIPEAKREIHAFALKQITEIFENDILPDAKKNSPVSEKYPSLAVAHGGRRIDTGANRRSLDAAIKEDGQKIRAELFSQSGHGGYLEVGTSKMIARPYLWPALERYIPKLKKLFEGLRGSK